MAQCFVAPAVPRAACSLTPRHKLYSGNLIYRNRSWAVVRFPRNRARVVCASSASKAHTGYADQAPEADLFGPNALPKSRDTDQQPSPLLRWFRLALRESPRRIAIAAVAVGVCIVAGACSPLLLGRVINSLVETAANPGTGAYRRFLRYVLLVTLTYSVDAMASFLYIREMTAVADRALLRLEQATFDALVAVDASFFDMIGPEIVTSALSTDPSELRDTIWGNLQRDRGVRAVGEAVFGVIAALFLSWKLALIYVFILPVIALVNAGGGLVFGTLSGEESEARARATMTASEALSSFQTVLSFGAGQRESRKFGKMLRLADAISFRLGRRKAVNDVTGRLGLYLVLVLFLSVGGYLVSTKAISLATYLSVQPYIWILNFSFQGILYTRSDADKAASSSRRIFSVLDQATYHKVSVMVRGDAKLDAVQGKLDFVNVGFAYPTRLDAPVLQSLNLRIAPGKVTALVGKSGVGKTTIGALLSRLYEPQKGTIFLDGVDITSLDRDWFSEQVAVVNQEPVLFTGTIREAIEYGSPDRLHPVSEANVRQAAKLANADEFIGALPQGYNTQVGQRGSNLSGGQKQRIAIARAILRNSPILLLDEATSALDTESEMLVQQALDRLMEHKTCLVIAHRLSTIKGADRIIVLGPLGAILEQGSYDELMQKNAVFSDLMRTQMTAFVAE